LEVEEIDNLTKASYGKKEFNNRFLLIAKYSNITIDN